MANSKFYLFKSILARDIMDGGGSLRLLRSSDMEAAMQEANEIMVDDCADGVDKAITEASIVEVLRVEKVDVSAWDGSRR